MKSLLFTIFVMGIFAICRGADIESTKDDFRLFFFELSDQDKATIAEHVEEGKGWVLSDRDPIIFHLRNGAELGRAVPALIVYRVGAKMGLSIIHEGLLQAAVFKNARIDDNEILIFEFSESSKSSGFKTARMPLIWKPELGLFFVARRGIEMPAIEPRLSNASKP